MYETLYYTEYKENFLWVTSRVGIRGNKEGNEIARSIITKPISPLLIPQEDVLNHQAENWRKVVESVE